MENRAFTVGNNSRIGANAVVLQEVPPNSTVVGVKARVVKIDGHRVPSFDLDQIHMPDPVSQELCRLEHRVYQNERRLGFQDESEPSKTVENSENGDCD